MFWSIWIPDAFWFIRSTKQSFEHEGGWGDGNEKKHVILRYIKKNIHYVVKISKFKRRILQKTAFKMWNFIIFFIFSVVKRKVPMNRIPPPEHQITPVPTWMKCMKLPLKNCNSSAFKMKLKKLYIFLFEVEIILKSKSRYDLWLKTT